MDARALLAIFSGLLAALFPRLFGAVVPLIASAPQNGTVVVNGEVFVSEAAPPKCDAPVFNATSNSTSYDFSQYWYAYPTETYVCWALALLPLSYWVCAWWNVSYCLRKQEELKQLLQKRARARAKLGDTIAETGTQSHWEVADEGETYWRSTVRRAPTRSLERQPTKLPAVLANPIPYSRCDQCCWRVCIGSGGSTGFMVAVWVTVALLSLGATFIEYNEEVHYKSTGNFWNRIRKMTWASAEEFSVDMLKGLILQWCFTNMVLIIGAGVTFFGMLLGSCCCCCNCCDGRVRQLERRQDEAERRREEADAKANDDEDDFKFDDDYVDVDAEKRVYERKLLPFQRRQLHRVQTVVPTLPRHRSLRGLDSAAACELRRSETMENALENLRKEDPSGRSVSPVPYGTVPRRGATPKPMPNPQLKGVLRMLTPDTLRQLSSPPPPPGWCAPSAPPPREGDDDGQA
jgi:hypothetical protein